MTEERDGLYEIPKSWTWTNLYTISDMITDGSHTPPPKQESGIPMLSAQNIFNDKILFSDVRYISQSAFDKEYKRAPVKQNDVLLTIVGTIGRSTVVKPNTPLFTLQRSVALVKTKINPNYLSFFFQSPVLFSYIKKKARGTAQKGIYLNQLKEIPIAVAPLNEQGRIVGKVDELFSFLDAGAESLHKVQAQLKRYRQAVLKYAFEGKLTEEWRKTHKDYATYNRNLLEDNTPDEFVSSPVIQKLPEEWLWIKFSKISESMKNGIYRPSSFYAHEGFACLRMYNIEKGSIVWKDIKRMKLTKEEIEEYELKSGDILVNRVNSRELVGKSAVIPDGLEPCVYESKNIRLRLTNQLADSKYVAFWILYYGQKYFNRNAQQTVGMASINQEQLGSMSIPFCSLLEQQIIVLEIERQFSVADASEKAIFYCLNLSDRLRQSVLKKAFEGKLVPQDPSDEPAQMLLHRINERKSEETKRNLKGLMNYVK